MKKQIPNLLTCCNVICGTLAIFMAMYSNLELAMVLIVVAMVFDFLDGFAARLLHVKSEMGKELDSLADVVSFGVAPAVLAHLLIKMTFFGEMDGEIGDLMLWQQIVLYIPLLIPAFSAYRLAKFNLDTRQSYSFIGMPTPANALFWISLVYTYLNDPQVFDYLFGNVWVLSLCVVVLSVLLVSELPMFSLKFKGFNWQENKVRYPYFICLVILLAVFRTAGIVLIVPLYIFFSAGAALINALNPAKGRK